MGGSVSSNINDLCVNMPLNYFIQHILNSID